MMATYTDLRNVVKENIAVGFKSDDRATLQKVRFLNEQNVYLGTLSGEVYAIGGELSGVSLVDPILNGVKIKDGISYLEAKDVYSCISAAKDLNASALSSENVVSYLSAVVDAISKLASKCLSLIDIDEDESSSNNEQLQDEEQLQAK